MIIYNLEGRYELKDYIDIIEDFPTEGISFKDITKLAANNEAFDYTIEELKKRA